MHFNYSQVNEKCNKGVIKTFSDKVLCKLFMELLGWLQLTLYRVKAAHSFEFIHMYILLMAQKMAQAALIGWKCARNYDKSSAVGDNNGHSSFYSYWSVFEAFNGSKNTIILLRVACINFVVNCKNSGKQNV